MNYFARNPKEYELLRDKHFTFVGLGSFGSALAMMAARAGLPKMTLIDPDTIAPENIGRHIACSHLIGMPKVEAVSRELLCVNPDIKIQSVKEKFSGSHLGTTDLVLCCTDSHSADSLVNACVLEHKVPAVFVGCWPMAKVGEIYYVIPGKTPCYDCYAAFRRNHEYKVDPRGYREEGFDTSRTEPQEGLWANILVICGITFNVLLDVVRDEANYSNLLLFNFNDPQFQPLAVTLGKVKKGCVVCDESFLVKTVQ